MTVTEPLYYCNKMEKNSEKLDMEGVEEQIPVPVKLYHWEKKISGCDLNMQ